MRLLTTFAAMIAALFLATTSPRAADIEPYMLDVGGVATALDKSWKTIGGKGPMVLNPQNGFQHEIVDLAQRYADELPKFMSKDELKVFASQYDHVLNKELKQAGSRVRLKFDPVDHFAVVSLLSVEIKFTKPAEIGVRNKNGAMSFFKINGKPAMRFTAGEHAIEMKTMTGEQEPLIVLTAKNGDKVMLIRTDNRRSSPKQKEAFAKTMLVCATSCGVHFGFAGAIVPMTLVDVDVNIDELKDLSYGSGKWAVAEAKQQVRFYLDPNGAVVKTETAVLNESRSVSSRPVYYMLDGGYYAVMMRNGMSIPCFSGWVAPKNFAVPPTFEGDAEFSAAFGRK